MTDTECLQERYAPHNRCFGCGPANDKGLRIRSFPDSDDPEVLLAEWTPSSHHEAFDNILNGGILGTLLDCHSNWAAAWHLMRRDGLDTPPCTVTADFHVRLTRPTPSDRPLQVWARPVSSEGSKVKVEATITSGGEETATCTGHFVAVKPGHPAYHRW
jgi:acyl-coenzyme A thioesterase PaaI-like protein